ncbi:MAG: carboxypeptidase regulatory-like domain-containing protein [Acidobacteriota bacterium]
MPIQSLLFLVAAGIAAAQATFEIRGRVLEAGTNHPLDDVKVTVSKRGGPYDVNRKPAAVTDAQGEFRFTTTEADSYIVQVAKAGYSDAKANTAINGSTTTIVVVLNTANPSRQIDLAMARLAEVTGRVVDMDSNQPVAKLDLRLIEPIGLNGKPLTRLRSLSTTAEDGTFKANVSMGSYALLIARPPPAARLQKTFTKEDAEATDLGYAYRMYPGGSLCGHGVAHVGHHRGAGGSGHDSREEGKDVSRARFRRRLLHAR